MLSNPSDLDFCPVLKQMLLNGHSCLNSGSNTKVSGTSTLNNIKAIRHALQIEKPSVTMEIGLAYGASALTFLATHAEANQANSRHVAIDPYQSSSWRSAGVSAIRAAGLAQNFSLIEEDSALSLPKMCEKGVSYGMIYVDGSHIFEDVFIDFFYCARLLKAGGLLLFDDSSDKHVGKVLRFIESNYGDILSREHVGPPRTLRQKVGNALGIRQLTAFRKVGNTPRDWNVDFVNF